MLKGKTTTTKKNLMLCKFSDHICASHRIVCSAYKCLQDSWGYNYEDVDKSK